MINLQQETGSLYEKAIARIYSDFKEGKTFSFHHYAVKFGIDAHRLQSEWVRHNHLKKAKQ